MDNNQPNNPTAEQGQTKMNSKKDMKKAKEQSKLQSKNDTDKEEQSTFNLTNSMEKAREQAELTLKNDLEISKKQQELELKNHMDKLKHTQQQALEKERYDQLTKQNTELETLRETQITALNNDVTTLEKKLQTLRETHAQEQASFFDEFSDHKTAAYEKLKSDIATEKERQLNLLQGEKDDLEQQKAKIIAQTSALRTQSETLALDQAELDRQKQDIELQLQSRMEQDQARIDKLQAQLKELNQLQISLGDTSVSDFLQQKAQYETDLKAYKLHDETLKKAQAKLMDEQRTLENDTAILENRREALKQRKSNLEDEIEEQLKEKHQDTLMTIQALQQQQDDLRERNLGLKRQLQNLEDFQKEIGGNPNILQKTIDEQLITISQLNGQIDDLLSAKNPEIDRLKRLNDGLSNTNQDLTEKNVQLSTENLQVISKEQEIQGLDEKNHDLEQRLQHTQAHNDELSATLERLQSSFARKAEREDRIKGINLAIIKNNLTTPLDKDQSEIEWLQNILSECEKNGFSFSQRILYAFHTSLKVSEWSSLSILAGVSGTGKSKLPQLYAAFGGINFMNVPVQPNWDSQESMLGYFNSIDNKFEATPVLRFLAQIQEQDFEDKMNIILLDEMNLAHIELYFAEFLSKLEERRGKFGNDAPAINVNLGAGIEPYPITLKRNILWVGTMNQDETTKSLSDKVIDRGSIINFPRPTSLKTIQKITAIKPTSNYVTWKTWIKWANSANQLNLSPKEEQDYRTIVEDINECLSHVGRALGHRVWQSMSYYMSVYPTVLTTNKGTTNPQEQKKRQEALNIAFEDQIVQKIMPKLRGIETRGLGGDCLNSIKQILQEGEFNLLEDFTLAQTLGHGQFIWNSAKYLEEEPEEEEEKEKKK